MNKIALQTTYGEITSPVGNVLHPSRNLAAVKMLAKQVDKNMTTFADATGHISFAPKLVMDMANRIEELELILKAYGTSEHFKENTTIALAIKAENIVTVDAAGKSIPE